jgi:hypothetical protein
MPPPPRGAPPKKKKKGHAPAHQNKFAFKHNPKSKLTDKILSSPNVHVCRRCYDKIEWRKQYRKYKPRTQPGVCNGCKKRNVLSAYHTICTQCTTDCVKAKEVIQAELDRTAGDKESEETTSVEGEQADGHDGADVDPAPFLRACAVCVKEVALPDSEEEGDDNDLAAGVGRIRLRELKTMERKSAKDAEKSRKGDEDDNGDEDEEENRHRDEDESSIPDGIDDDDDGFDEDDPFLKAIGGAEKFLTGEAYQQKLLRQHQQQQTT